MATGRTASKFTRVFIDGYDMSGYSRSIGPLATEFEEASSVALSDGVKGVLQGQGNLNVGTLNGIFDNTVLTGLHALFSSAGVARIVSVAIGIRAVPAIGDPVFTAQCLQRDYTEADDGGAAAVTMTLESYAANAATRAYGKGWGRILANTSSETAPNTATGIDDAAATTRGGYFVYHVLSGNGTATLSVDDSADNVTYNALSGATSGSINTSTPSAGIIALSPTATVRRYLRWQLALGTATDLAFLAAFVRG